MTEPQRHFEDVSPGDQLPAVRMTFTPRHLVMFAGAALDFYEIHYDRDVARSQGLDGLLVHGALKNALLGRYLHEYAGPRGRVASFGCQYRGMDRPDEELVCRGTVTSLDERRRTVELEIHVEKADGTVTTPGNGLVILPSRAGEPTPRP